MVRSDEADFLNPKRLEQMGCKTVSECLHTGTKLHRELLCNYTRQKQNKTWKKSPRLRRDAITKRFSKYHAFSIEREMLGGFSFCV